MGHKPALASAHGAKRASTKALRQIATIVTIVPPDSTPIPWEKVTARTVRQANRRHLGPTRPATAIYSARMGSTVQAVPLVRTACQANTSQVPTPTPRATPVPAASTMKIQEARGHLHAKTVQAVSTRRHHLLHQLQTAWPASSASIPSAAGHANSVLLER